MVLAHIEWTGALCTVLALACVIQLLITGLLSFSIPHFLSFSKTQMATGVGVIAGCVTLPTVIRVKTSKITPNMDRIYGYTIWYQRLAIGVCSILHLVASIVTIHALFLRVDFKEEFLNLMKEYHLLVASKSLTDNIQWNLQCCGAASYEQWFAIDWSGYNFNKTHIMQRSISELLREDTDGYPDLATIRYDAVPFSCCKRKTINPCIHQNLIQFGTSSINTQGCDGRLYKVMSFLLVMESLSYSSCLLIEILLLGLSCKTISRDGSEEINVIPRRRSLKKSWSHFSNAERHDVPTIVPTSQTVLLENSHKNMIERQYSRII